ncbi:uncharacterized protein Z519_03667 [Cladophialophora bantiana CBS 173.52]|uniref:Ricin B lectin domain-containing protein n=1 Tax=Cladophialophora bantiana (strain ATCC 10958 / CBS 173.52 / CDC B-1940 / NIH 8579) TaxID=1442370 RepID=A0A0D2IE78_CLAB1|nr:uncharacterized protein Z519_03667 [Cladophialophora bantiana CBS 173.52]KIW95084.1 hypothetical protein Z519_03667 [Cladophialophora bantiana CBS 173.52]
MNSLLCALFLGSASFGVAHPIVEKRAVTALDQAAFEEAQQRDDTATRAFSSIPIKTSDGRCLFVDQLSGDFRANLTPIQVGSCDGSIEQQWDIITAGKHNDRPGAMLIVSTLAISQTQACFNFDPRRAAGNQVLLFSCGGRADGSGTGTNSQLFPVTGSAGPLTLTPENAPGDCLTFFMFGDASTVITTDVGAASPTVVTQSVPASIISASTTSATASSTSVTLSPTTSPPSVVVSTVATASASASIISVSRAGSVLNPSAAAEANPPDNTATRAFSSVSLKSASGLCLFIDPTAGDFRENLIPITLQPCDGSANQRFNIITAGIHNDQPNSALIVSILTQGCLNFDPRRAAGDTVIMFSCGGRADGSGQVTNSQLFSFTAGEASLRLQPENGAGAVCLVADAAGRMDQATCSDNPSQVFNIS